MSKLTTPALFGAFLLLFATACVPIARPGSWRDAGPLTKVSHPESLTPLRDGGALVLGDGQGALFDPRTSTWSATTAPPEILVAPGVVALADGTVLVFGGRVGGQPGRRVGGRPVADAFIYSPAGDRWTATASMTTPRDGFAVTKLADGRVIAIGGVGVGTAGLVSAEIYDPASRRWTATADMSVPRYGPAAALAGDGRVIVINGWRVHDPTAPFNGKFPVNDVEAFDPANGRWSPLPKLPLDLLAVTLLTLADGKVVGLGGVDGPYRLSAVQVFDPALNTWSQLAPMKGTAGATRATLLDDHRILVIRAGLTTFAGGFFQSTAGGEVYDPDTGLWLPISVRESLMVLKFARLASGDVLAVGFRPVTGADFTNSLGGVDTAIWEPSGYPRLPGSEGPLASPSLAAAGAALAAFLLLVLAIAHLRVLMAERRRR